MPADGGGIRGVSELLILDEIMSRLKRDLDLPELPRPCDYFHLIGGTSTGGQAFCTDDSAPTDLCKADHPDVGSAQDEHKRSTGGIQ
jgi:Patatin-like phospholipase